MAFLDQVRFETSTHLPFDEIPAMLWRTLVPIGCFSCMLVVQATSTVWAQDESREERFFRYLDRDNDGRIAGDELSRLDERMQSRLKEAGLDPKRDIRREDFVKKMQERSDSDRGSRDRDSRGSSSSRKPAPPPPLVLKLPANYAAMDKNGDNQLGLYEWERAKYAEFLSLDRNGDGFVTAKELANPTKTEVVATPGTASPGAVGVGIPGNTVLSSPSVATPASPSTPVVEESPETKRAKYFFSITDKNKDGEVSAEEWGASRGIRGMFEKASITPTLPLKEAVFVEQFLKLSAK